MQFLETWLRLARYAFGFVFVLPRTRWLLVLALISTCAAAVFQRPIHRNLWKSRHWLALTQFFFFPAILAAGVIWANPVNPLKDSIVLHPASTSGVRSLYLLWYSSLASSLFWVWQMKGFRWFAISLMTLIEVLLNIAIFIAWMSISGRWI